MSFGRISHSQLSWCIVCGQAVVSSTSGPIGMGVRIDNDTIVHEHCFKCSSCHKRLSLETYRKDKTDQRFYCAKHHNGFAVVGSSQSLPRERSLSVQPPVQLTARSPGGLSPRTGFRTSTIGPTSPKAATFSRATRRPPLKAASPVHWSAGDRRHDVPPSGIKRRDSAPASPVSIRSGETSLATPSSRSACSSPTVDWKEDAASSRSPPPVPGKDSRPGLSDDEIKSNQRLAVKSPQGSATHAEKLEDVIVDDSYLDELRKYKRRCLRTAEQLEMTADISGELCLPNSRGPTVTTPRQFKRLPIPEEWSHEAAHFVQSVYGYNTEATGSPKFSTAKRHKTDAVPRPQSPSLVRRLSDVDASKADSCVYQVEKTAEDAFAEFFKDNEHWTFYTADEPGIGPCVLSVKQETSASREQFRVVVRSRYNISHGLLPATCLLANRYDRDDVVRSMAKEMGFVSRLQQTTLPKAAHNLHNLDKSFNSRQLKVGLLYVKSGQTTEEAIFNNKDGSRNFEDFMDEIGNKVRLKDFGGYRAGLDVEHEQTGDYSLYRQWSGYELMFHVSTLLPHNNTDRQQVQKKRHIGNDVVCVVFVDDMHTPFSPTSIRSHFLHTFLVVHCDSISYPKRYRVDVVARDTVPTFGPPLAKQNLFPSGSRIFGEFFMTKLVNACRASIRAPKFYTLKVRTTGQVLEELTASCVSWDETHRNSTREKKRKRRGSWLPPGANRPPSPFLDAVRERFVDSSRLSADLGDACHAQKALCDVNFLVGENRDALPAVKAILAARSLPLREYFLERVSTCTTPLEDDNGRGQLDGIASQEGTDGSRTSQSLKRGTNSSRIIKLPKVGRRSQSKLVQPEAMTAPLSSSPLTRRRSRRKPKSSGTSLANSSVESARDDPTPTDEQLYMTSISENDVLPRQPPHVSQVLRQLAPTIDVYTVEDFSVEAFSAVLDFMTCGVCPVLPRTVGGIASAAAVLNLEDLEETILSRAAGIMTLQTTFDVLRGLEPYYTRHPISLQLFDMCATPFIEKHAADILSAAEFRTLKEVTVRKIFSLSLDADEMTKFKAAQTWAEAEVGRRHGDDSEEVVRLLTPLVADIKLHKIAPADLMHVVLPSGAVENESVMMALAYQVDPGAVHGMEGAPVTPKKELLVTMAGKASSSVSHGERLDTVVERAFEPRTTGV